MGIVGDWFSPESVGHGGFPLESFHNDFLFMDSCRYLNPMGYGLFRRRALKILCKDNEKFLISRKCDPKILKEKPLHPEVASLGVFLEPESKGNPSCRYNGAKLLNSFYSIGIFATA